MGLKKKDTPCQNGGPVGLLIDELPMPHSVNRNFIFSHGRFIKSRDARLFDSEVRVWAEKRKSAVKEMQALARSWVTSGYVLRVDIDFFFERKRLFSTTSRAKDFVKSIDVNNRIKPLLDAVVLIIGVDDKFFFEHFVTKKACKAHEQEHCKVSVLPIKLEH
ncbi:MAG: RusA family crossover junction endodeoxyribonuclease [Candidatus Bathyarchaeia archaeon]